MAKFGKNIATKVRALAGIGMGSFQNTITSSNIKTTATALTNNVTGGPIYIENIIVESDGTGLAGSTNFKIIRSGSKGTVIVYQDTVANLGANYTSDLFTAATTKQRIVLFPGEQLQFQGTVAAGTGSGKIYVTVIFRRVTDVSDLTQAATT